MNEYMNNAGKSVEAVTFWKDLKSGRFASMVKESSRGNVLGNAQEVCNIMKPFFAKHDDVEKMYCIFLDAKNKIIAIEKMFSGSIRSSAVYPREVVKKILKHKAVAVILSHNHPSGDTTPSPTDVMITSMLYIALSSIDVTLHDHLIVGDKFYSFAEQGWLAKAKQRYNDFISSNKYSC